MPFVGEETTINLNYRNFLGLQNEVLNYGFNDGPQVNRERIKAWLNEAQFQIAREVEAPEFQSTQILLTEAGEYKYPLPEAFLRTQDIVYPALLYRLRPTDIQQFDQTGRFEGPPARYTVYGKELWLWPTPHESGEELEHRFIANPPWMVNDEDVPELNPNYWHLLVRYAAAEAFLAEDDFEASTQHRQIYERKLDAYATDVQGRSADRPHVIGGTWAGMETNGYSFPA
jgi:hypothetical protein